MKHEAVTHHKGQRSKAFERSYQMKVTKQQSLLYVTGPISVYPAYPVHGRTAENFELTSYFLPIAALDAHEAARFQTIMLTSEPQNYYCSLWNPLEGLKSPFLL